MVSLKRIIPALVIAISLCIMIIPGSIAEKTEIGEEDLAEVTFTNYLEWTIYYLFISPSDSDYYGADVMDSTGAMVMITYDSILLYMVPGEYDVLILDEDYDMWYGTYTVADGDEVLLSETSLTYEIYGDDEALIMMDIWVETSVAVEYLFISPADSTSWGMDILGIYSVEPDDILTITLPEYDTNQYYDLLAVYEDDTFIMIEDIEAFDGADIYLFDYINDTGDDDDIVVDDDDDVVVDDDDDTNITDDDDDIVVDDDDDIVDDDDDDTGPGGVSGGSLEGDEKKKDSNALGLISIIAVISVLIGIKWVKQKK
jgi:hypothetical protein